MSASHSPWQWEWILLSRVGFLCPTGHSLSGTHWCSPGQKHCSCFLDGWRERDRDKTVRGTNVTGIADNSMQPLGCSKKPLEAKVVDEPPVRHYSMQYEYSFRPCCLRLTHHPNPVHNLPVLYPCVSSVTVCPHPATNLYSQNSCNIINCNSDALSIILMWT